MKINISNQNPKYRMPVLTWRKQTKAILQALDRGQQALNVIFTGEDRILQLNREYLRHNYVTDVISFAELMEEDDFLGEIYICLEQAECQASEYHNTFEDEVLTLIIHGILHLSGYDDLKPSDRKKMVQKQQELVDLVRHA